MKTTTAAIWIQIQLQYEYKYSWGCCVVAGLLPCLLLGRSRREGGDLQMEYREMCKGASCNIAHHLKFEASNQKLHPDNEMSQNRFVHWLINIDWIFYPASWVVSVNPNIWTSNNVSKNLFMDQTGISAINADIPACTLYTVANTHW